MKNKSNQQKIKRLIRFLSRKDENGYLFAYPYKTDQIKGINQQVIDHFLNKNKTIGLFFFNPHQNKSLIQQLKIFTQNRNYSGIIVANLYALAKDNQANNQFFTELNFAREQFYQLNLPLLFWITKEAYPQLINNATDLYTQRRLPTLVFEPGSLPFTTQIKNPRNKDVIPKNEKTSIKQQIAQHQYEKALKLNLSDKEIVNNYLINYLLVASENHQTQLTKDLYKKHQDEINQQSFKQCLKLGQIFNNIHDYNLAIQFYSQYINQYPFVTLQMAKTLLNRGTIYHTIGKLSKALKDFKQAETLLNDLSKKSTDAIEIKHYLSEAYSKIGSLYKDMGRFKKAIKFFESDLILAQDIYNTAPNNSDYQNRLAIAYSNLGAAHNSLGNLNQALTFFENDLKLTKELNNNDPKDVEYINSLSITCSKLGDTYRELGDLNQAIFYLKQGFKHALQLTTKHPNNLNYLNKLALMYLDLGETYQQLNNGSQIHIKYYQKYHSIYSKLVKKYPDNNEFKINLNKVNSRLKDLKKNEFIQT